MRDGDISTAINQGVKHMKCGTCKTTVSKPDPWNEKSGDCDEWVLDGDNLSWSIWPLEWKLEDDKDHGEAGITGPKEGVGLEPVLPNQKGGRR
jgi:hypothetical protein